MNFPMIASVLFGVATMMVAHSIAPTEVVPPTLHNDYSAVQYHPYDQYVITGDVDPIADCLLAQGFTGRGW